MDLDVLVEKSFEMRQRLVNSLSGRKDRTSILVSFGRECKVCGSDIFCGEIWVMGLYLRIAAELTDNSQPIVTTIAKDVMSATMGWQFYGCQNRQTVTP